MYSENLIIVMICLDSFSKQIYNIRVMFRLYQSKNLGGGGGGGGARAGPTGALVSGL